MPLSGRPLHAPLELSALLDVGLRRSPDATAVRTLTQSWSWSELDAAADRLAAGYLGLGLRPGDCLASLMPNRGELLIHYVACLRAGLVATPLNYRYMAPEIDYALGLSESKTLLVHDEREADLARSTLAGSLPLGTIRFDDDPAANSGSAAGQHSLRSLMETPTTSRPAAPDPDAPIIQFFTSGSTGRPKGVTHSSRTLGWIMASLRDALGTTPEDTMLAGSSASHCASYICGFATTAAGGGIALARTFDAGEILPLLRATSPSLMVMLPSALYAVVRDHGATREDFSSIRICISGGDKVSDELEREFTELTGTPIHECYGMSETGVSTVNITDDFVPGSIGVLAPGFEGSVRDADRQEVPTGTDGRLWIRFPGNMIGYWRNPEATEETIVDGWLDTGDVVRLDEDGRFWFRGRQKQIIVHDGSNISPQEIEGVLLEHEAVTDAGVVGVHDRIHGENVRAFVTLDAEQPAPTMQSLIEFARERVGYKAPEEIVVLDEMPFNATGKVDRVSLKQRAAERAQAHHV